eukprot:15461751-Alexandrium_andersonii.AAC.1
MIFDWTWVSPFGPGGGSATRQVCLLPCPMHLASPSAQRALAETRHTGQGGKTTSLSDLLSA